MMVKVTRIEIMEVVSTDDIKISWEDVFDSIQNDLLDSQDVQVESSDGKCIITPRRCVSFDVTLDVEEVQ